MVRIVLERKGDYIVIYFTADTHFYNKEHLQIGHRCFKNWQEKQEYIISQWNDAVSPIDEIYLLGDISDGAGEETNQILSRLNGIKYLVIGNHDFYLNDPVFDQSLYAWARQYHELLTMNQKFVLFHFPIEAWSGYRNDRFHLHGHLHRSEPIYEPIRRYEVGIDAHDGRPVSIEAIWEQLIGFHNANREMPGFEK